jgi:hypothetical protein
MELPGRGIQRVGTPSARESRSVVSVSPGSAARTVAWMQAAVRFPGSQVERLWASYRGLPSPLVVRRGATVMAARSVT